MEFKLVIGLVAVCCFAIFWVSTKLSDKRQLEGKDVSKGCLPNLIEWSIMIGIILFFILVVSECASPSI